MSGFGPMELFVVLGVVLWVVPSYLVAAWAKGRGQSFAIFFVLGLATSFLISWLVALVIPELNKGTGALTGNAPTFVRPGESPGETFARATGYSGPANSSKLDRLDQLAGLHQRGALSDEEFATLKAEVLAGR